MTTIDTEDMPPGVSMMLDVCTCHRPKPGDDEYTGDWGGVRWVGHEYGWTVFVHNLDARVPTWLKPLWDYANAFKCTVINFDSDAAVIPGLPTWDW